MTAGIPEGQMPYFCETLGSSEDGVASLLHSAEKLKVDVRVGGGWGGYYGTQAFKSAISDLDKYKNTLWCRLQRYAYEKRREKLLSVDWPNPDCMRSFVFQSNERNWM